MGQGELDAAIVEAVRRARVQAVVARARQKRREKTIAAVRAEAERVRRMEAIAAYLKMMPTWIENAAGEGRRFFTIRTAPSLLQSDGFRRNGGGVDLVEGRPPSDLAAHLKPLGITVVPKVERHTWTERGTFGPETESEDRFHLEVHF